jgi:hypothetical protein
VGFWIVWMETEAFSMQYPSGSTNPLSPYLSVATTLSRLFPTRRVDWMVATDEKVLQGSKREMKSVQYCSESFFGH